MEKNFYPDSVAVGQKVATDERNISQPANQDVIPDFVLTEELRAKLFLVDKYNLGICHGQPESVPDKAVSGMINRNPGLAQFLKENYNLATDLGVYYKIRQINSVQLQVTEPGSYNFNFVDAQCCTLNAYKGKVTVSGQTFSATVTKQETQNNPY